MADTNHVTISTLSGESAVVETLSGSISSRSSLQGNLSNSSTIGGGISPATVEKSIDYERLINLPKIEGTTLIGDKTFEELNLNSLTNSELEELLTF